MRISRARFSVVNRQWQQFLANPYVQHAELMACFDGDPRLLFRVESQTDNGLATVLVQSLAEPQWENSKLFGELAPHLLASKPFSVQVDRDALLRFRLRANPTVKRAGRREPVVGDDALNAWLERKLGNIGASLRSAIVICDGPVRAKRPHAKGGPSMTFSSIRFEGHLNVNNSAQFQKGLESGIGSAKAFGFGLLSLARA